MTARAYFLATAILFSVIALVHLVRIILGWEATVAGWPVPMWLSWAAIVVTAVIAFYGLRLARRS